MIDSFRTFCAFVLLFSLAAVPAAAGSWEDGYAAFARGD